MGGWTVKVLDLFSGIGGFSLGLERAGMETVAFCEFDKHAQKVLKKHWPHIPIHEDVRELDGKQYRGSVDVVCGGFPCQDLSNSGLQKGFGGERSSLYREMLRIIGECRPRYAIFENVTGLLTGDNGRWFAKFLYDLAEIGFDAEWHCIEAGYVGAPHRRNRVWVVAYPNARRELKNKEIFTGWDSTLTSFNASADPKGWNDRVSKQESTERQESKPRESSSGIKIPANANGERCEGFAKIAYDLKQQIEFMRSSEDVRRGFDLSEPALCGADDGVPLRLDRLRRLGNSVVPQIPEAIGRAIMKANNH